MVVLEKSWFELKLVVGILGQIGDLKSREFYKRLKISWEITQAYRC